MTKIVNFDQAEKKARKRDFDLEKLQYALDHGGVPQEFIENAMELLSKATGKELYIGTKRSPQSKVRFVQIMQDNLNFLYENGYLTGREKIFLMEIMPYVAFDSNGIVLDIKAKNPIPANISEIADLIGADRSNTSKTINSLKRKGLLFKGESGLEGNNAKAYAIFINPHVIYAGDKDNVNEALKIMFHKAMKMPILKDLPNKLF
ncbi:helix-turn-helix domain-containing protein [Bacillus cytotoxicus]|uniref:helix-turn-helix domain-containing protein n=1 Tax=Bacillus cytotoxicus TaxID=580165 RepID=UPI0024484C12|nr:helix-turn-helix domain-containing protein [Bacillus cytotoxicus]MDH2862588.1 MarR family transcriptional regulator [Bacillus cytotoxicus]HDR7315385.1 MarR family transcriptional regulator [Bacillus cytotoxicus]